MEYLHGVGIAIAVGLFGSVVGMDRDRAFYSVVLIIVAAYYILFAVMGGSEQALAAEAIPAALFVVAAVLGFRRSPWFLVAGLIGHGVFDFAHASMIQNPGVPLWWPGFCLAYDVTAGVYLAVLLKVRGAKRAA